MITPVRPNVQPDGRYSKAESCRKLGDAKPIDQKTLNRYIVLAGITPKMRKSTNGVFLTGKDILYIWNAAS